jgi:hypothetical protein
MAESWRLPDCHEGVRTRLDLGRAQRAPAEGVPAAHIATWRYSVFEPQYLMLARPRDGWIEQGCATPIPCGSRPSTAALTRLGERKASEIVMFTCQLLQSFRAAMASMVAVPRLDLGQPLLARDYSDELGSAVVADRANFLSVPTPLEL